MQGNLFKCKYFLIYSPALASIASYIVVANAAEIVNNYGIA